MSAIIYMEVMQNLIKNVLFPKNEYTYPST